METYPKAAGSGLEFILMKMDEITCMSAWVMRIRPFLASSGTIEFCVKESKEPKSAQR